MRNLYFVHVFCKSWILALAILGALLLVVLSIAYLMSLEKYLIVLVSTGTTDHQSVSDSSLVDAGA